MRLGRDRLVHSSRDGTACPFLHGAPVLPSNSTYIVRTGRLAILSTFFAAAAACSGASDTATSAEGNDTGSDVTASGDAAADSGGSGSDATAGSDAAGSADTAGGGTDAAVDTYVPPDLRAPKVVDNSPNNDETGVTTTPTISVVFDERMKSSTITTTTFTLSKGGVAVGGKVSNFSRTASFAPSAPLSLDSTYTATVTADATDLAGNHLAAAHTWSFKTDTLAPIGPAPVYLGASGRFAILAKSAITNVPTSLITGDIAVSPAAATYITGFVLTRVGTRWTSPEVVGSIFAADSDVPTPSDLTVAVGDLQAAYTDAAGRGSPTLNLGSGAIGGLVLTPGLYKWTTAVPIPTDVTFSGGANDVWIMQITGGLTMAVDKKMLLVGGARPKNIFWQVAEAVDFSPGSHAEGIVLTETSINLGTGASINGRLLAQTAVTIAKSTVTMPAP